MIRLAILGTGSMANSHAKNFKAIKGCKVVACCDIVPGKAAAFAERHGIPAAYESGEEMLEKETVDGVSVVTPDRAHCECALLVIKHGLHVLCEKPLSDNLKDARRMAAAARAKKLITAVNFSYRDSAATQKAAQIVAAGKLGRVIHVTGNYLQGWLCTSNWEGDWHGKEQRLWRLSKRHGSLGDLGDIGVHLYDLATFVLGDIASLACKLKTFQKPVKRLGPYVFDANDSFASLVTFANGALGTLHSSRWAAGQLNTVALRVWGDQGGLDLNLDRAPEEKLRVCLGPEAMKAARWEPVECPKTPTQYERFVTALRTGKQGQTSFEGAVKVQALLDRSVYSDEHGGVFVKVR